MAPCTWTASRSVADSSVADSVQAKSDEVADQLATAAANVAAVKAEKVEAERIRGSPYLAAGGRWSSVKGASVWRRTFQIYSFAIKFAIRYWRIGKEGTYKKLAGGMSPENVSVRKTQVACWLREELIKLGPTFIKIGQQFSTRVDVLSPVRPLPLILVKLPCEFIRKLSILWRLWQLSCM